MDFTLQGIVISKSTGTIRWVDNDGFWQFVEENDKALSANNSLLDEKIEYA